MGRGRAGDGRAALTSDTTRRCPACGGAVRETRIATQYQEELPVPRVVVRQFRIHIGTCRACGRRVQGRHPLQTSDALGAASAQLGTQVIAFAVILNKQLGLSFGKIATLLHQQYGLTVTRSGLVHAVHRAARQAQPTYAALRTQIRGSPVVTPDETAGKSRAGCSGSGRSPRPTRRCMPFSRVAAIRRPPACSATTSRASSSATGRRRIDGSPRQSIRPVSRICCGGVVSC